MGMPAAQVIVLVMMRYLHENYNSDSNDNDYSNSTLKPPPNNTKRTHACSGLRHPLRCPLDWCTIARCIERHYYDFDGFVVSWQQFFLKNKSFTLQKSFTQSRKILRWFFLLVSYMRVLDYLVTTSSTCGRNHAGNTFWNNAAGWGNEFLPYG